MLLRFGPEGSVFFGELSESDSSGHGLGTLVPIQVKAADRATKA